MEGTEKKGGREVANREKENRKQERNGGRGREGGRTPKLFGVIAVRSRFSPFLPVHYLLLLSCLLFLSPPLPPDVLSGSLSCASTAAMFFFFERVYPTALYACEQPSRVRTEKEERRERKRRIEIEGKRAGRGEGGKTRGRRRERGTTRIARRRSARIGFLNARCAREKVKRGGGKERKNHSLAGTL